LEGSKRRRWDSSPRLGRRVRTHGVFMACSQYADFNDRRTGVASCRGRHSGGSQHPGEALEECLGLVLGVALSMGQADEEPCEA
jgi:hypothetical protein